MRKSRAGDCGAVAVLGKKRFYAALANDITVENLADYLVYIAENVAPFNEVLVICGRVGYVEIIPS